MFQFLVYSIFIILMVFVKKKLPYFFKSANKSIVMQKKYFCYGKYHGKASIHSFFENSITTAINFAKDQLLIKLLTYYT